MAKNRLDVGDIVASSMQQIIQSDEHRKVFYKKANNQICCKCDTCGEDCPCEKCAEDCKGCVKDNNHVHDATCGHDKKANAVNEIISLLSKISTVQEELGLNKSSLSTMKALADMVNELKKTAQEDVNNISYDDLIQGIKTDPEQRHSGKLDYDDFPELMGLLRQRIQESESGKSPSPIDIFEEGVSNESVSDFPKSYRFSPVDEGDLPTWGPESEREDTDLPPESLIARNFPGIPSLPDIDRGELDRTDFLKPEEREMPTIPVPKTAFDRLNILLKKKAQEDIDFEDEDDSDAVLQSLMDDYSGDHITGNDLEEMLLNEEPDFFAMDQSLADDIHGSDLDQEMENGDFLKSPKDNKTINNAEFFGDIDPFTYDFEHEREDADPGFTYPGLGKDDTETVRVPGKGWVPFKDLGEEEKDELESGAGMRERLDMDPDELSTEEVYPDEIESTYSPFDEQNDFWEE